MPRKEQTAPARSQPQTSTAFKSAPIFIAVLALILALYNPLRFALTSKLSRIGSSPASAPAAWKRAMATTTTTSTTTTTTTTTNSPAALQITKRPWDARGHADHDWLYTFHTFSFASYHDAAFDSFGPLRVLNEDRVARGTGFGAHAHAEFLIWSYVVAGELEHRDSLGHTEAVRRGDVQFTSAGTGVRHSEFNRRPDADAHFLQIWATPAVRALPPSYCTRRFDDAAKTDALVRIMESTKRVAEQAAGEGGGEGVERKLPLPIALHADLSMSASILSPGKAVVHELVEAGERKVYLHVVMGGREKPATGGAKIKIGDVELGEGDGAFVRGAHGPGTIEVESVGDKPAEFLLFDMGN